MDEVVMLGHGSGGTMMKRIIDEVFFEAYAGEELRRGDDAAVLAAPGAQGRLAFSTDSFVVTPHFFPGVEPDGLVHDVAFGRQEDHRDPPASLAHAATHLEPIHPRHHDIQDKQVGLLLHQHLQAARTVLRPTEPVARALQNAPHQHMQALVVVDKHDLGRRRRPRRCSVSLH